MKTIDRIRNRAFFYSGKYLPSREKFRRYLFEKFTNHIELVEQVLEESKIFLHEENNLSFHIDNYLAQKKSERYIKSKLLQKLFPKEMIEKLLQESDVLKDWDKYSDSIQKKIQQAKLKGKSKRITASELTVSYPYFKTEIHKLVEELYDDEISILQSTYPDFPGEYKQSEMKKKQKMMQKLISKGFSFDTVKKFLSAHNEFE